MTKVPQQWRAYFARQAQLDQRGDTTSTTWGIEAGLNYLLDTAVTPTSTAQTIAAAARRSRYAQALLAKFVIFESFRIDGLVVIEARSSLTKIEEGLPAATVSMLLGAARGNNPDVMAANLGISLLTFQTRLSRARAAARKLAA